MIRFVFFLLLIAVMLYGVFWAIDRRTSGDDADPVRTVPSGPVGPDDDEAFLRGLDTERRRHRGDPPTSPGDT